jgi:hypothetical protein
MLTRRRVLPALRRIGLPTLRRVLPMTALRRVLPVLRRIGLPTLRWRILAMPALRRRVVLAARLTTGGVTRATMLSARRAAGSTRLAATATPAGVAAAATPTRAVSGTGRRRVKRS